MSKTRSFAIASESYSRNYHGFYCILISLEKGARGKAQLLTETK